MTRPLRGALAVLLAAVLLALLAGLGGALHPAGDSLAVFRVTLGILALGLCVLLRRPVWLVLPGAVLVALLMLPQLPWPQPDPPRDAALTLYQQNLLFNRTESAAFVAQIRELRPDVLTLQEVSQPNLAIVEALRDLYPHVIHCPLNERLGEAVLSRLPVVAGSGHCTARDGIAFLQVETQGGPLWIGSVHLTWPWPHPQPAQVAEILPEVAALDWPAVLAGDFNAVGWSHTVRSIARAAGARRVGPKGASFVLPRLGLPLTIDHVLAPQGMHGTARVMPRLGSDHRGVMAWLGSAPQ